MKNQSLLKLVLLSAFSVFILSNCSNENKLHSLYVGTYGDKALRYDFVTSSLETTLGNEYRVENSSYIVVSDIIHNLYAVTESGASSAVSAFKPTGELINSQPIPHADPCFLINYENNIITANYSGGSISILPIDSKTGALLPPSNTIGFKGSGPVPKRQESSHIHTVAVVETEQGDYLLATDLGGDRIYIFTLSVNDGNLSVLPNSKQSEIVLPAGSGPRHIAINPSQNLFYVLCELSGMVLSYKYDDSMACHLFQALPSDRSGAQASADIHIDPTGNFLYTSTRKENDGLEIFRIEQETGFLWPMGHIDTFPHPRNFAFTPDGHLLLVASKDKCSIQIFKVDKHNGRLTDTHKTIDTSPNQPVCLIIK